MTRTQPAAEQVGIIGLGYVGVSLAAVLADEGIRVYGVDINSDRVRTINDGTCPFNEDRISELFEFHSDSGRITASESSRVLGGCSTIIVTVGTPLDKTNPDTSAVEQAAESLAPHVEMGNHLIFRSTLPAGETETNLRQIVDDSSGLNAGEDYALAFCPERMAEGSAYDDLTSLPVVVGGYTDDCTERVETFWQELGHETVSVSSPTAAELTKLADNWWIDLNIALANEVALLAEQLGVDAMEVIHAANTLPKGDHNVNILYPGSGVGGSCLLKDPWFVANLGDQFGLSLETPRVSRRVNNKMPEHVVDLVAEGLSTMEGADVTILGYAFKAGTDDTRNTPAKEVIERLDDLGANIRVTDPFVSASTIYEEVGIEPSRLPEALAGADALVVVTGHEPYGSLDTEDLISYVGDDEFTVVDGRFVFDPSDFIDTSITYRGVGRGDIDE
jgi:UDP-N-acetyl-D-mannosaminuronic acid dehydrogenase